jgi:glycosyltransferase involved in cell wall biosynthesis
VIGSACGAAPEIVEHGLTGYLSEDPRSLADAVRDLANLDRGACRAAVEVRFSAKRMAAEHVEVFEATLAEGDNLVA